MSQALLPYRSQLPSETRSPGAPPAFATVEPQSTSFAFAATTFGAVLLTVAAAILMAIFVR